MITLFTQTLKNLGACFAKKNLVWHFLACALTAIIVFSGFDWFYFTHTQGALLQSILFPAVIIGGLLPMILPFILYAWAKVKRSVYLTQTSFAVGEAAIIGWFLSSFYKAFTGRIQPSLHSSSILDISREFQFGFLRHGIFWGWPSSHTTVAFAVAVTVFVLYPKNIFVKYGAILLALYIGIGVSTNIHWFSDFVAGAIFGSLVGIVVGTSFKKLRG